MLLRYELLSFGYMYAQSCLCSSHCYRFPIFLYACPETFPLPEPVIQTSHFLSPKFISHPPSHTFPLLISPHKMKFYVIICTIFLASIATALPLSLQERHALTNAVWLTPSQINLATPKKSRSEPSTATQPETPLTTSELMGLRYQGPLRLRSVEIL